LIQKAQAICHGAATIVSAIATGQGAAFGVDLWTKAQVELTNEPEIIKGEITSDPKENTKLIETAVKRVFDHFQETKTGAKVTTWSNIPIARGLKSSSTAANAIILAATAALGKKLDDKTIINLGVDAAFDAKVTVTGAFDDACAAYFGNAVVADNLVRKIIKHSNLLQDATVLFHVPNAKSYTVDTKPEKMEKIKSLVRIAYNEALKGNYWEALTLNGLIYSASLGFDTKIVSDALEAGALAAGLCGKGPATTVVTTQEKLESVKARLQKYPGEILQSNLNHEKAKVIQLG
jgi:shikimate kinase